MEYDLNWKLNNFFYIFNINMHNKIDFSFIMVKIYIIVFSIMSLSFAFSQNTSVRLEPIDLDPNWESWVNEPPISGLKRQGLQFVANKVKVDISNIMVYIPQEIENKKLCLRITTFDSRYHANLSFLIKKPTNGMVQVHVPSKFKEKLKKYKPEEIALMATIDDNCAINKGAFLISSWTKENNLKQFIVQFNSRKDIMLLALKNDELIFQQNFKELIKKTSSKVSFNKYCRVPFDILEENVLIIIRKTWVDEAGILKVKDYPLPIEL